MRIQINLRVVLYYIIVLSLLSFVTYKDKEFTREDLVPSIQQESGKNNYVMMKNEVKEAEFIVEVKGKPLEEFKEKMGHFESRGNYEVVNKYGYLGKYQFGKHKMDEYGVESEEAFLKDPEMQERLFHESLQKNKWKLRNVIRKYKNIRINGVLVSESGILAAAHLAGVQGVKNYFSSFGKKNNTDAFGTSIQKYMKEFEGYDLSEIVAKSK